MSVTPSKLAGLSGLTRELADDSSPEAAAEIGAGLARDIARKLDAAFFGSAAAPAPAGLGALTGTSNVDSGAEPIAGRTPLDDFTEAVSLVEQVGSSVSAWVAHPSDALKLAQLKSGIGSDVPLLSSDPTSSTRRVVEGRQMLTSAAVPAGTVYGIPQDRAIVVMRDDTRIESDRSVYFTSDMIATKATMRVGFAFPHVLAIAKVGSTDPLELRSLNLRGTSTSAGRSSSLLLPNRNEGAMRRQRACAVQEQPAVSIRHRGGGLRPSTPGGEQHELLATRTAVDYVLRHTDTDRVLGCL